MSVCWTVTDVLRVEYLGSSTLEMVPKSQPANDGNLGIGIFISAPENTNDLSGSLSQLIASMLMRHDSVSRRRSNKPKEIIM